MVTRHAFAQAVLGLLTLSPMASKASLDPDHEPEK